MGLQPFAAQLAVERFDECIVRGLIVVREIQGHTASVSPRIQVPSDELAAVVAPDRLGVLRDLARPVSAQNLLRHRCYAYS